MKQQLIKAGVYVYRSLPIGGSARRKLRAAVLTPFLRNRAPFVHEWRGSKVLLDPKQSMDMRLYFTGDYEPETLAAIAKLAEPGSAAIDVGANIGLISLWISKCVGPTGKVIGVEPSNWAVERLKHNAELSGADNIVSNAAVADKPGEADMTVINGYRVDDVNTVTPQHVKMVTIDGLVAEHGITRLSLLKVDTDGYEVDVFRGAEKTLAELRPNLVFELGPDHLKMAGSSVEVLIGLLAGHGYSFFTEDFAPVDPLTYAVEAYGSVNLIGRPN